MLGKMSVGVRMITTGLSRRISRASTMKVYGRSRATFTIHIEESVLYGGNCRTMIVPKTPLFLDEPCFSTASQIEQWTVIGKTVRLSG
jgi:hypothetical protein